MRGGRGRGGLLWRLPQSTTLPLPPLPRQAHEHTIYDPQLVVRCCASYCFLVVGRGLVWVGAGSGTLNRGRTATWGLPIVFVIVQQKVTLTPRTIADADSMWLVALHGWGGACT